MAFFSGLRNGLRHVLDPARLAISQRLLAGDYGQAAEMLQRFRQLQAERERLNMWRRPRGGDDDPAVPAADSPAHLHEAEHFIDVAGAREFGDKLAEANGGEWSRDGLQPATQRMDESDHGLQPAAMKQMHGRRGGTALGRASGSAGTPGKIGGSFDTVPDSTERSVVEPMVGQFVGQLVKSEPFLDGQRRQAQAALRLKGVNGWGYVPQPGDQEALARHLFAEAVGSPADMTAIAGSTLNRVRPRVGQSPGRPENRRTLNEVIHVPGHYPYLPNQNRNGPDGSPNYALYAHPERMTAEQRRIRAYAQRVAALALAGKLSDPTGGSTFYFSSHDYDGTPQSARGDFRRMLGQGLLGPSRYSSPYPRVSGGPDARRPTYFFYHREDVPEKHQG